jgi:hypothetical protein
MSMGTKGLSLCIALSLLLLAGNLGFRMIYQAAQGPIEGSVAVKQLDDSKTSFAVAHTVSQGFLPRTVHIFSLGGLLVMWLAFGIVNTGKRKLTSDNNTLSCFIGALLLLSTALSLSACGPYKVMPLEEIKPNETAFLVPLEGASKSDQGKFMSIEYLEGAKVATKRVEIPTRRRETSRMPGGYEWIPTMKVIRVDRSPVTRELTKGKESGTSSANQAIAVESLDSIGFSVGVNTTAMIEESDAAKFLYYFAGKPLSAVMDENVRGYVQTFLGQEFGKRPLQQCKEEKAAIFQALQEAIRIVYTFSV